ncbi:hypothetical protein [Herbinix luporum]|uniref:hypothetical protein n=1 Tax=Herbinix luporum TaxID=1679721 RepID=UPI0023F198EE|nr:hypothetical protein [Herbinix luporum]
MIGGQYIISRIYKFILKVIMISVGVAVTGMGVALLHKSGLGSSPIDTLASGINKTFGFSLGARS